MTRKRPQPREDGDVAGERDLTGEDGAAANARGRAGAPGAVADPGVLLRFNLLVPHPRSLVFKAPTRARPLPGMASNDQVDSFRELRTRLLLMGDAAGLEHFTTMVVPIAQGCGASFVARNLAAAFTLQHRLALLIDCNFARGTQDVELAADGEAAGLAEFLAAPDEVPLDGVIRPTPLPGLHVIAAGGRDPQAGAPREHFSSPAMKALMSWLKEEPCDVFLDGPVVEGSPDARILSELADFVVLVVGYGRATSTAVARAASQFDPKKIAGVVFNEVASKRRGASGAHRDR